MPKRRTCPWCGRGPNLCAENGCIGPHVKAELVLYIQTHGHRWRSSLRDAWTRGADTLRQLRNSVGPSRLANVCPNVNSPEAVDLVQRYGDRNR